MFNQTLKVHQLDEFKRLFKKEYGVDLSNKEAMIKASYLLGLYKQVYIKKN